MGAALAGADLEGLGPELAGQMEAGVDPAILASIINAQTASPPSETTDEEVETPTNEESGEGHTGDEGGGGGGGGGEDDGGDPELPPSPFSPAGARPEAPPIEPADLSGETPEAVASGFKDATPTQRAMGMGEVGPELTEAGTKQNAATNEAKPELTAEMSGEMSQEGPTDIDTATAADPNAVGESRDTNAPEVVVEAADVGEDVPLSASAATSRLNGVGDESSQEDRARAIGQALNNVPSGGNVNSSVDVPNVPLEGEADPAQMEVADADAVAQQDTALADAARAVAEGPGPEQAQLLAIQETVDVEAPAPPAMPEFSANPEMAQYLDYDLPAEAQAEFDEQQGEIMATHIGTANVEMETAEADYNTQRDQAFADAQSEVDTENTRVQSQQESAVSQARTDITTEQNATVQQQRQAVQTARGQMETERQSSMSQIDSRVSTDQSAIDGRYTEAQTEADQLVSQGEADAARHEREAQQESENQSWWDRAVSAVTDALNSLVDLISDMWSAIRDAVAVVLDAAVAFANDLIDACLAFVTELLNAYCALLQFLVQELLGDVFPELAAALCAAIDAVREFVVSTLESLAEALKAAVAAIAAGLLAALDGLIALIEAAAAAWQALITAVLTGDWAALAEMAIRAVLSVIGIPYEDFVGTLGKLVEVWDQILADPGAVVRNGIDALVLGFENFAAGFVDHFIGGAVEWITGAQGLQMPETFDIMGIFDITCQVLGLTTEHLEEKAREHLGDGAVDMIVELMGAVNALMEGGWGGLWEYVQDRLSSLVDDVVIAMGTWLVEKAILVAGRWIAGLAATFGLSAILEALIATWQFAMWIIDQAAMMWGIVSGVIDSVHEFVFGNIAPAAAAIENALADMIPVAIDLVAKLLNIGNIADKVQDIIEGVREMIDGAIDAMFETLLGALGFGGDSDEEDGDYDGEVGETKTFSAAGESHRMWIEANGSDAVVKVASTPMTVDDRLDDWNRRIGETPSAEIGVGGPSDPDEARAQLSTARTQAATVDTEADQVLQAPPEQQDQADDEAEAAQAPFATTLAGLFRLYADGTGTFEELNVSFDMNGESHNLYITEASEGVAQIDMASRRAEFRSGLTRAKLDCQEAIEASSGDDQRSWQAVLGMLDGLSERLEDYSREIGTHLTEAKYGDNRVRSEMHAWMDSIASQLRALGSSYGLTSLTEISAEGKWVVGNTLREEYRSSEQIRKKFYGGSSYSAAATAAKNAYVTGATDATDPTMWLCPCCNTLVDKTVPKGPGEPTIEHMTDVAIHWNDQGGRGSDQSHRLTWFSLESNHEYICRSCNSGKPKTNYLHQVEDGFTGPDGLR